MRDSHAKKCAFFRKNSSFRLFFPGIAVSSASVMLPFSRFDLRLFTLLRIF